VRGRDRADPPQPTGPAHRRAQPFHYIDPQWNVVAGAELVVLDGFHPSSFWAKVREHRVTYFYCLGAMPNLLLSISVWCGRIR
jgi:hypothetical protein